MEISGIGFTWDLMEKKNGLFLQQMQEKFQEHRYTHGTVKKLIDSLAGADKFKIIKRNEMIMLTDLSE